MSKRNGFALITAILSLIFGIALCPNVPASDNSLSPQEVVARHLRSIGSPEALASITSRAIKGITSVKFANEGVGNIAGGKSLIASEGRKIAVVMNYGALNYPGEHLAYDGKDVTVGYVDFDQRSPLGAFVNVLPGLMKEGLWGGTLSTAWPLLDMKGRMPTLKYKKGKIDGRDVHKLSYDPKSRIGLNNMRIDLFFDSKTFRHIRTEYRYTYAYSLRLVVERFDDFRSVDGLTLPYKYYVEYSSQGWDSDPFRANGRPKDPQLERSGYYSTASSGRSSDPYKIYRGGGDPFRVYREGADAYIGNWNIVAEEFLHNTQIDPLLFIAQDLAQWRAK